jgi:hypothetical protein
MHIRTFICTHPYGQILDDFDPTPEEVLPQEGEFGTLSIDDIAALNGTESTIIADTFDGARTILVRKYR